MMLNSIKEDIYYMNIYSSYEERYETNTPYEPISK